MPRIQRDLTHLGDWCRYRLVERQQGLALIKETREAKPAMATDVDKKERAIMSQVEATANRQC